MRIEVDADITKLSSYRTKATASLVIHIESREDFFKLPDLKAPIRITGNGSNILFKKSHYDGTFIHLSHLKGTEWLPDGTIRVMAGETLPILAKEFEKKNVGGMEELTMIPGTVGAAVIMNAGAHQTEIAHMLVSIETFSLVDKSIKVIPLSALRPSYRHIDGVPPNEIIISAILKPLNRPFELAMAKHAKDFRVGKFPSKPNCGSVFKNPPNDFAGRLIESCGLKGLENSGARVSFEHANIFENYNEATGESMFNLFESVRKKVFETHGVALEYEVRIFF